MTNEALEKTVYDLKNTIAQTLMTPTNKAGWPFIIGFAIVSVILAMVSSFLGVIGLVLTLWCVYFFRDPVRFFEPGDPAYVVSDGSTFDLKGFVEDPANMNRVDTDPMLTSTAWTANIVPSDGYPLLSGAGAASGCEAVDYVGAVKTDDWTVGWTQYALN